MKFDTEFNKKAIIIVVSSVAGLILLCGIIAFASHFHRRYVARGFNHMKFSQQDRKQMPTRGTPGDFLSGIENILTSKDYTQFQKIFSGSRILQEINSPEKFALWIELQTTLKKAQDLTSQLFSGTQQGFPSPVLNRGNMMTEPQQSSWMGEENMRKRGGRGACY